MRRTSFAETALEDLLGSHRLFTTDNIAAARAHTVLFKRIEGYEALHRGDPFRLSINSLLLDDVRISLVTTTGHRIRLVEDESVTLLLARAQSLESGDRGERIAAGDKALLIPDPGRRVTVCAPGYQGLVVQVPLPRLRRQAALNPEDRWQPDGRTPGLLSTHDDEGAVLGRYLRHLVREIDQTDLLLRSPRAAGTAATLLAELLGDAWWSAMATEGSRFRSAGVAKVERAEAMMRERLAEPLSIAELAGEVGVTTRALQMAFQQHRGRAPRAVLEAMRLDAVRARLLSAAPEDSITTAALDCGITHLGRFAARYRTRFGEAPLATLRRGRSGG